VGAVGIENNADRNFKEVEGRLGSVKELKRNNRECKEILIGPSMAPRFRYRESESHCSRYTKADVGIGPKFGGTDGKPTTKDSEQTRVGIYRVWVEHSAMARMLDNVK
jgi:hypothetical protein